MSKYKPKNNGTPEVHSARSKLDGLLQNLVEKTDESSPIKEEIDVGDDSEYYGSLPNTPTKRPGSAKSARKRKKPKDDMDFPESGQYRNSYVRMLFDRSVNLALFAEDSPLYTISRAWIRNDPLNPNLAPSQRTPSPHRTGLTYDNHDMNYVYRLPEPVTVKTEPGVAQDSLRIPVPLPTTKELDIDADPSTYPSPKKLLLDHMDRWKKVRKSWQEAAASHESQYAGSMKMLKELYEPS